MKRAFVLLLVLAACGSSHPVAKRSPTDGSAQSSPGAAASSSSSSSNGAKPGASSSSGASGGSVSPKPSTQITLPPDTPDHAPGTDKAPLTVSMGRACVVRGTAQTITIKAPAGFQLSWATLYSDGKAHQEFQGWGIGSIPPTGEFTGTWTLPPTSPLGPARTDVAVAGKINGKDATAYGHGYWKIATSC